MLEFAEQLGIGSQKTAAVQWMRLAPAAVPER